MKTELEATEISSSSVRQNLSKIIDAVRVTGERILVTQHRRPVAAVIGVEDLELLQLLEDRMDVAEARRRMKEPADKVSLEELRSGSFLEDKLTRRKPKKARGRSGAGRGRLDQDFRFGSSDGTSLRPHPAKRNHFSTR